jgi:hypothetical protein
MKINFIILSLSNQLEKIEIWLPYDWLSCALNYQAKSDMFALS